MAIQRGLQYLVDWKQTAWRNILGTCITPFWLNLSSETSRETIPTSTVGRREAPVIGGESGGAVMVLQSTWSDFDLSVCMCACINKVTMPLIFITAQMELMSTLTSHLLLKWREDLHSVPVC